MKCTDTCLNPNDSFRYKRLQHNLVSLKILNLLFIIYNILTLASSSFFQYVTGINIPYFHVLNLFFCLFLLFNIFSLFFIRYTTKKKLLQSNPKLIERYIFFTIILATSWSGLISTLNQSTYKHMLLYTFTIVFCAAFFIIASRLYAPIIIGTSIGLTATILIAQLPVIKTISLILFILTLDIMTIILATMTYQTAKKSFFDNQKLRKQYEINEQLTKKLEFEANYDLLTQMFNRRGFNQYIEKMCHFNQSKKILSVVIIDIDFFKQYNDFYGHAKGDIVLKRVANTIMQVADEHGFITARWGGEEFIAVAQNDILQPVTAFSEQLIEAVSALNIPHVNSEVANHITVSIGSTSVPCGKSHTVDSIFDLADEALYIAKGNGRNQFYHL